ncbi:MAG: class I SAM-dependent DNA methyltransferase [Candidatus Nanopelagicales bacterium]
MQPYELLAGVYDQMVVDPCYASWATFLDQFWGGSAVVPRVLDVCCGTGLLAAELVERGYQLVGTDASAAMLARARSRLGPSVPLHRAELPEVGTDEVFDAVVSTFDGLNYVPLDTFPTIVARLADRLGPGGWLVFDLHTDAMMHFTLDNPVVTGEEGGRGFRITSEVDPDQRTCATTIEFREPDGHGFRETHRQFFHSDAQVTDALLSAGLVDIQVLDEYSSQPADQATLRATWIARRPSRSVDPEPQRRC